MRFGVTSHDFRSAGCAHAPAHIMIQSEARKRRRERFNITARRHDADLAAAHKVEAPRRI